MSISLSLLLVVLLSIVADAIARVKIQRMKIIMTILAVIGVVASYFND